LCALNVSDIGNNVIFVQFIDKSSNELHKLWSLCCFIKPYTYHFAFAILINKQIGRFFNFHIFRDIIDHDIGIQSIQDDNLVMRRDSLHNKEGSFDVFPFPIFEVFVKCEKSDVRCCV
jgi:hypothetical protein